MSLLPVYPHLTPSPTLLYNVDVVIADNPIKEMINFKNIKVSYDGTAQDRMKQQWEYPKRDFTVQYTWITKADALILWNFFIARGGSFEAFKFLYPFVNIYENVFVSICDGAETVFDLPALNASAYTIYVNDVIVSPGDYTYGIGQGANGEDAIGFTVAPEEGSVITMDFTGYLVARCRFDEDLYDFETFYNRLSKVGIKLKGLLLSEQFGIPPVTVTTSTTTTTT